MYLWIDIRIDADKNIRGCVKLLHSLLNVAQIKFAVNVNQHTVFNCKTEFFKGLTVAV